MGRTNSFRGSVNLREDPSAPGTLLPAVDLEGNLITLNMVISATSNDGTNISLPGIEKTYLVRDSNTVVTRTEV